MLFKFFIVIVLLNCYRCTVIHDFDGFLFAKCPQKRHLSARHERRYSSAFSRSFFSAILLGFLSGPPVRHRKCLARPARHSDRNEVERV